jgi:CBS domain-containing protein
MLIRDILNLKGGTIYSIDGSEPLTRAVSMMVEHNVGSLVVMDAGRMAGMLTFREVLQAIDAGSSLAQTEARQVMVKDPVCGSPGETIDELRELMTRNHIRYLPVKDGERLAGVISFHDVAKAVIKETSMENRLLRRYIEGQPASKE